MSATTAMSALSAAAIGPLADGDPLRYAALSAALGVLAGVVLAVKFLRPGRPAMSLVVAGAIVVGEIPRALPDPAWPEVSGGDFEA
jgi:hypothetical protein